MKPSIKKAVFLLMLIIGVLLSSACGQKEAVSNDVNANPSDSTRGFSQNRADLYGEVKSITESEVTIALLEMPQRGPGNGGNGGARGAGNQNQGTNGDTNAPRQSRGNGNQNQGTGNPPRQGRGNGNQNQGTNGGGNGQGWGGGFSGEKKYTGQSETLTIASDTPITTFGRGNGTPTETQLKISDIKEGSLIQVWYKKDSGDKKEIQNIRVIPVPASTPAPASN